MQPQPPKSIGGALMDVFDAALALVKTEIRLVGKRVGQIVKEKGLGAMLLLAAAAPLSLALIFLILALFYGLIALGLPAWASALIIAILALAVTGALVMLGIRKLTAEVKNPEPTEGDLVREDVGRAEKKLEKAERDLEKNVEKSEKRVDSAERALEKAREEAQRMGVAGASTTDPNLGRPTPARVTSTTSTGTASTGSISTPSPVSTTGVVTSTGTGTATSRVVLTASETSTPASSPTVSMSKPHLDNPNITGTVRRQNDEDGIPVSTKPQLDELDK